MMHVVISHAYSARNSGDGLLVDETVALVKEALGAHLEVTLLALDPESFPQYRTLHPATGEGATPERLQFLKQALSMRPHPSVRRLMESADLVVAVGGGYLRASSATEYVKVALAHLPQMPHAKLRRSPFVYLPQSIGPFPPKYAPSFSRRLACASLVAVRDDRSKAELAERGVDAQRYSDLAVMAVTREWQSSPERAIKGATIGLVLRALPRPRDYVEKVRKLRQLQGWSPFVQSTGRGNDDPAFYRKVLGERGELRSLKEGLAPESDLAVTTSVRLHGSLQSILSGVPSIHLSYERKGWGAFSDLGLEQYVHNARDFDVDSVIGQAEKLREDPSEYWSAVSNALPQIEQSREKLVRALATLAQG